MPELYNATGRVGFDTAVNAMTNDLVKYGSRVTEPPHQMTHLKDDPRWTTIERTHILLRYLIHPRVEQLQYDVRPNLPWAEEHFQERVSGVPHNPPPSHSLWPYAQGDNAEHRKDGKFSHTYPERMWPREAMGLFGLLPEGIRFKYGDLNDLLTLLADHPYTRQAYLPIWFPEDLTAANQGERVPCTLGYHFLMRKGKLNVTYFIRSCDLVRFFRDDVYMACRLCQWVADRSFNEGTHSEGVVLPGCLTMHIVSLHCFEGDLPLLRGQHATSRA